MYVLYIPCTRTAPCRGSLLHILKTKKSNGQIQLKQIFFLFLPPATKLGQGYVFTRVCDSVQGGGMTGSRGGLLPGRVSGAGAAYPGGGGRAWSGWVRRAPMTATTEGGMHPTGMHSCFPYYFTFFLDFAQSLSAWMGKSSWTQWISKCYAKNWIDHHGIYPDVIIMRVLIHPNLNL